MPKPEIGEVFALTKTSGVMCGTCFLGRVPLLLIRGFRACAVLVYSPKIFILFRGLINRDFVFSGAILFLSWCFAGGR